MTIEELYDWAKEKGIENFWIDIQYRDGGGSYSGSESASFADIEIDYRNETVTL